MTTSPLRILVTGASGLIGTALTASLARDGHTVVRLVRHAPTGPDTVAWDPAAGSLDAAALEGFDGVVHLAGEGIGERKWSPAQKDRILRSRVDGTSLLARTLASLERPPAVLVSASAIGFYGDRGDEMLDESSTSGSGFLADVCRQWEAAAQPAIDAGIRTVFPRTGIVLSTKGGALQRQLLPFRLGLGGKVGTGRQYQPWITLDDEVAALRHLLTADGLRGPVNLTAPEPVPQAAFAKALARVLHRPAVLPTPLLPLKLVYGGELVRELLLSSARVMPRALLSSGFGFSHTEIEPALRDLVARRG